MRSGVDALTALCISDKLSSYGQPNSLTLTQPLLAQTTKIQTFLDRNHYKTQTAQFKYTVQKFAAGNRGTILLILIVRLS